MGKNARSIVNGQQSSKRLSTLDYRLAVLTFILGGLLSSCATYYQANYEFNRAFESGRIESSLQTLRRQARQANGRDRFLYFVNKGLVLSMLGKYDESNEFFEKAYLFWEDYKIDYFSEGASYLLNPTITVYRGENHEHLILLYYKALNFLKMNKIEEALVECRRLNIRLQQLSDRYSSDNNYKHDAFINNLMGIIYDAGKDYNNAFIAYRNSLDSYKNEYEPMFQLKAPIQLKKDLLRTAWLSGLTEEFSQYKSEFEMEDYQFQKREGGELIFFWHNGLAPFKAEWSINFSIDHGAGNFLIFNNQELGLSFRFPKSNYSQDQLQSLARMEFFRVAFPRYIERPVFYDQAEVEANGVKYRLELTENISKIAFNALEERMGFEFGKALARVALKKAAEHALKKENENMGALLGLFNTFSEKADTRNWQTLPHSVYYARVPLPVGETTIRLNLGSRSSQPRDQSFTYKVTNGQVLYHTFTSLEVAYPNYQH